jgi:hypothetical protein
VRGASDCDLAPGLRCGLAAEPEAALLLAHSSVPPMTIFASVNSGGWTTKCKELRHFPLTSEPGLISMTAHSLSDPGLCQLERTVVNPYEDREIRQASLFGTETDKWNFHVGLEAKLELTWHVGTHRASFRSNYAPF